MMAYANTRLCRHGFVSAYFGGRQIDHCTACDNCLSDSQATAAGPASALRTSTSQTERESFDYDEDLFQRLRAWRKQAAEEHFGTSELKFISDFGLGAILLFGSILAIVAAHRAGTRSRGGG